MSTLPRQSAAFWFTSTFLPAPLAIGFLGPLQGLTLWQSLLAIIPAVLLGSLVPYRRTTSGILLFPVALVLHALHLDLLSRITRHLLPGQSINWQLLALTLAASLAFVGPRLLYRAQAWLAAPLILAFALLTLGALLLLEVDTAQRQPGFSWSAFGSLGAMAALWQIALTPLASKGTPHYLGLALPALWLMSLGALMASAIPAVDSVVSLRLVGERTIPGLGSAAVLLLALAMVGAMAVHCHAQLVAISAASGKTKARVLLLAGLLLLVVLWNPLHFSLY